MEARRRIAVAGATGKVGRHAVEVLEEMGHDVVAISRSAGVDVVTGVMSTEARGASNAKAKHELGWTPCYPTWRTGFKAVYSAIAVADRPSPRPASRTSHSST